MAPSTYHIERQATQKLTLDHFRDGLAVESKTSIPSRKLYDKYTITFQNYHQIFDDKSHPVGIRVQLVIRSPVCHHPGIDILIDLPAGARKAKKSCGKMAYPW